MSTRSIIKLRRRARRPDAARGPWPLLVRLHRSEHGSMSLVSVFTMLLLTMLLGMVINSARQVDSKIRLQNAADASTYSGGVVLARGMNTLAFTNHLLCDIFSMTAILREGRDGNARSLTPDILRAWENIAPVLSSSGFAKFDALGNAIPGKVQQETDLVNTYSDWIATMSADVLPLFEQILEEEAIPQFQRAVVETTPLQAQIAVAEVTRQHTQAVSTRDAQRGPAAAVLWRTWAYPVGGDGELMRTTLPVVDLASDAASEFPQLREQGRRRRNQLAHRYLSHWNHEYMRPFDEEGKMSQFGALWRGFTCGQLRRLLEENQDRNLPMMLRPFTDTTSFNNDIEQDYTFIGVTNWGPIAETMPGIFRNPLAADAQAFAQGMLFLPTRRFVWVDEFGRQIGRNPTWFMVRRQGRPQHWDLWNQNWTFQLVPGTAEAIPTVLSQNPSSFGLPTLPNRQFNPPALSTMNRQQLQSINTH